LKEVRITVKAKVSNKSMQSFHKSTHIEQVDFINRVLNNAGNPNFRTMNLMVSWNETPETFLIY